MGYREQINMYVINTKTCTGPRSNTYMILITKGNDRWLELLVAMIYQEVGYSPVDIRDVFTNENGCS